MGTVKVKITPSRIEAKKKQFEKAKKEYKDLRDKTKDAKRTMEAFEYIYKKYKNNEGKYTSSFTGRGKYVRIYNTKRAMKKKSK